MATATLASLLIIASCLTAVSCLQCYSCVREHTADPLQECAFNSSGLGNDTNVNCSSNENRCIIVKTVLEDGSVTTFRRACVAEGECPEEKCTKPDEGGTVVCKSCCEKDLCNKGEGPTPPTRSPISSPAIGAIGPTKSGSSKFPLIKGLYMFGAFLAFFLVC